MRIRSVLVTAAAGLLMGTGVAAADAAAAGVAPAPLDPEAAVSAMVSGMTLEQKVGQLFVAYEYGDSATTTDPAYTAQNRAA